MPNLHEYVYSHSRGAHSASKQVAFVKSLVRRITDTEDYDNLDFLVTRYDEVHAYLEQKGSMTRNRYATHILGVFALVSEAVDPVLLEACRTKYRLIVSTTKRSIRAMSRATTDRPSVAVMPGTETLTVSEAEPTEPTRPTTEPPVATEPPNNLTSEADPHDKTDEPTSTDPTAEPTSSDPTDPTAEPTSTDPPDPPVEPPDPSAEPSVEPPDPSAEPSVEPPDPSAEPSVEPPDPSAEPPDPSVEPPDPSAEPTVEPPADTEPSDPPADTEPPLEPSTDTNDESPAVGEQLRWTRHRRIP